MSASTRRPRAVTRFILAAAGAAALVPLSSGVAMAGRTAVALTADNQLFSFDTDTPGAVSGSVGISGLDAQETLLGIDFRPAQPSQLYSVSSFGQIYQVNAQSGSATKIGSAIGPADLPLQGSSFGFDFNPTVDRIRLVDDLGANARLNQTNGTVVDTDPASPGTQRDGDLDYAPGDVNQGQPAGVNSVAYSNSDNDPATGTTLYGIDSAFGVLVTIDPPNDGVLNTIGSLNQSEMPDFVGFDIFGPGNEAFAVTGAESSFGSLPALQARLFSIDLSTGAASELGVIGDGSSQITGLALTDGGGGVNAVPLPSALLAAPLAGLIGGYFHRRARRQMAAC